MVLRALLLSALLTLVPVGVGVVVADDTTPDREPPAYAGTPLTDFDSRAAVVQRAPFCDRIHPEAVREALGGDGELTAYGNGESAEALPGGGDVSHEYGCVYSGADGADARAWVFAPPVPAEKAAALAATAPGKGCEIQPDAPAYGDPSVALVCRTRDGATASYRGLFGDAWLSCSLTLPAGSENAGNRPLLERTGRWCVAVARAASPGIT